jgi:hypothetical protein
MPRARRTRERRKSSANLELRSAQACGSGCRSDPAWLISKISSCIVPPGWLRFLHQPEDSAATMTNTDYLGPFRNLPNYQDVPSRLTPPAPAIFNGVGKVWSIDFDVRPQRTCLVNGQNLHLKIDNVDWDALLIKAIWSVVRTLRMAGDTRYGIEGEGDDGTVTCWISTMEFDAARLREARNGLRARILRQSWPDHHADCTLPSLVSGRDRIGIQVIDPQSRRSIPMLAENFYFVNQSAKRVDAYPLNQWDDIVERLQDQGTWYA